MIEIAEFKLEDIEDAVDGLDGLREIIEPFLRKANYEGMGEQDAQDFVRHITLAKHALILLHCALSDEEAKADETARGK